MTTGEAFVAVPGGTLRVRAAASGRHIVADTLAAYERETPRYRDRPDAQRASFLVVGQARYRVRLYLAALEFLQCDPARLLAQADGWGIDGVGLEMRPLGEPQAPAPEPVREHVRTVVFPALAAWLHGHGHAILVEAAARARRGRLGALNQRIAALHAELAELEAERDRIAAP